MLQFLYVVLFERSFDSSTGWGERASGKRPFAAGHLQDTVGRGDEKQGEEQQTLGLVYFIYCLMNCDYDPMLAKV
jgi:hypothetical protein